MKFSERYGYKPIKNIIQIESIDSELRNGLWNCLLDILYDDTERVDYDYIDIWENYFKLPVDKIRNSINYYIFQDIKKYFFKCQWYEVYDLIEFILDNDCFLEGSEYKRKNFINKCNEVLKRELSGYRIINNQIVRITSEEEINEVEKAINNKTKIDGIREHLITALKKLSDRKNPDYRNSIKESISAVEALGCAITGNKKASLGQALKLIEKENKIQFHKALKEAFEKIYGYTSDEDGIRHKMLSKTKVDFEDARFMLIACSAFVNYLIEKANKSGINVLRE